MYRTSMGNVKTLDDRYERAEEDGEDCETMRRCRYQPQQRRRRRWPQNVGNIEIKARGSVDYSLERSLQTPLGTFRGCKV
jgi:hypothetical protein